MGTPVTIGGRIIWSSGAAPLDQAEVIDDRTKQPKVDAQGNKVMERGFGLAIPKTDPRFPALWAAMTAEAAKVCNGAVPPFPNDRVFAYKLLDGDSMDKGDMARGRQPKPYSDREGYGGCWIITIKSQLPNPPPVFDWLDGRWQQIDHNNIRGGGNKLKVGDYVDVGINIDGHAGSSPGLYMNPQGIQFLGFGTAISRGPDAETMFGAGPGQLPPGASAAPVGGAPAGAAPPAMGNPPAAPGAVPMPGTPATAPTAGPSPAPAPGMTASPSSPAMPGVTPVPGFAAGAPQMPGMTAPAPAPAPAPAAPPARVQAGTDAQGRPYYFKAGSTTETEY